MSGNYAYVASFNSNALEIVDVSNPASPVHKGSISNGAGALLNGPTSVYVSGNYAYIGSAYSNALEIVDVSNPASPVHKGSIVNGAGGALLNNPSSIYMSGNYAYVASFNSNALEIVDVSYPASPVHKGSISNGAGDAFLYSPTGVYVFRNYAYVVSRGSNSLEIVDIGTVTGTSVTWQSSTQMTCSFDLTNKTAGLYNVVVTNPDGSFGTLAKGFTVISPPIVASISPTFSTTTGGASVTITGTGFTGATAVNFGTTAATTFTINSDTQITATSPAGSAGTVDITVMGPYGTSVTSSADTFTYAENPTVSSISPSFGPTTGGASVTITGTGFTGATAVNFGTTAATTFTINSDTQITATSPAGSAGTLDITVNNPYYVSATSSADQYTYVAPPIAAFTVTPTSGSAPLTVSFTDSSTGGPTGWAWFFGDENYTEPWTQQTASAGWSARSDHTSVAMPDGSIVLMGGYSSGGYKNDVWRSTNNGSTWTQQTASAGWSARGDHSSVAMPDGSIVLMGGSDVDFGDRNDTWRSTDDGAHWLLMNASSGWSPRDSFGSVAMPDGSIILMGGYDINGPENDTWRSTDNGATWVLVNASAGWSARYAHTSVAEPDGSIVLMGGAATDGSGPKNDVWRSTDEGAHWTRQTASAGWPARYYHTSAVMPDGSIVLMGGANGYLRDVWRSTDNGATWTEVTASAGWSGRWTQTCVVMPDGSIVLMGGGDSGGLKNDVWRFNPAGSSVQNPSHTYTTAGIYQIALQAFNNIGFNITLKTGYITVSSGGGGTAPSASFSSTSTSGTAPLTVSFTDSSSGSPTGWAWFFGDENYTGAWTQQTPGAGWGTRAEHTNVVMPDGSIVLMGGLHSSPTDYNDVWRSTDQGATWTEVNASAGWSARYYPTSVALSDGSIVLMGGYAFAGSTYYNDVWRSTDNGTTWTEVNASAGWSARECHSSVALPDDSIVLMGGTAGSTYYNDVWRSTDNGAHWTEVNASAGWSARYCHSSVAMPDGSIILMGGSTSSGLKNDVWRSTNNGATWTQVNTSAGWAKRTRLSSVAMPDGSIVLMGGEDASGYRNDVWQSIDNGATWIEVNVGAEWSARSGFSSVAMPDGSIVLMGGQRSGSNTNDVWRFQPVGSSLQSPSHIYTSARNYTVTLQAYNSGGYNSTQKIGYINVTSGTTTIPITGPAVISSPGTYELQNDITNTPSSDPWNGITITTSHVTFDGMGHTIDGVMPSSTNIHGVYAYTGGPLSDITVKNVTVNGTWQGIDFYQVSNGQIEHITGRNNYDSIFLISSTSNTISNCTVSAGTGIAIWPGSNSNTITDNVVSGNSELAIYDGQNNIVTNNTFENSYYGIKIEGSSATNNQIYHNNIRNNSISGIEFDASPGTPGSNTIYDNYFSNTVNVNFDGTILGNTWNTTQTTGTNINGGPYLGGNYWANPSGTGYSQTCIDTNHDRICDFIYTITTGNIDYLPLASASGIAAPVASFSGTPSSGTSPLTVSFSDSSSHAPTGWAWFFGDENYTQPWTEVSGNVPGLVWGFSNVVMSDGSIVLMGGYDSSSGNFTNDVWRSTNEGATWTQQTASAGWSARGYQSSVALPDGSIVLMGGYSSGCKNDVWRSTDYGATWTLMNASTGWSTREYQSAVAMPDGSIVLMGGRNGGTYYNDVWRSTDDGTHWTQQTASAGWSPRAEHSTVVMSDGSIVLMGGEINSFNSLYNDTWRSTDNGATWTEINASAGWSARGGHCSVVMPDGSVVLMGGGGWPPGGVGGWHSDNDVWRSIDDGATWTEINASAGWPAREGFSSMVIPDSSIILMGGYDSHYMYDVWRFQPAGSSVQNPSHTYTAPGNYQVALQAYNAGGYNSTRQTGYITASSGGSVKPTAMFYGIPTSGTAPLSVSFSDMSSHSPTGWAWFFGDENYTDAWTQQTANAGWLARSDFSSVMMSGGSILLMGGNTGISNNDVWRSTNNGVSWTEVNASAGWTARFGHTSVALPDGSIVLMGGFDGSGKNDVWRSTDNGATWTQQTASAGWVGREYHSSVAMPDGSIVLTGGETWWGSWNDTWRSTDKGATWTQQTSGAAWTGRKFHSSVALPDGSIVLMGGLDDGGRRNDVWRSTDNGITWTQQTASAGWTARTGHSSVALPDGSIVLMGGYDSSGYKNDVWRSTDNGITWTQLTASAGWTARNDLSSVAMPDGSIVLMGGWDSGGYKNDVWRFQPTGSSAQNPSHTYTAAGNYTVALQAYNTGGYTSTRKTGYITVSPGGGSLGGGGTAPVAGFTTNVTSGTVPFAVQFNDTSTGTNLSWNWNFGDGNTSIEQNPVHTFVWPQVFNVKLTVMNSAGLTNSSTVQVTGYTPPVTTTTALNGTSFSTVGNNQTLSVNITTLRTSGGSITNTTNTTLTVTGGNAFWQTTTVSAENVTINATTGDYTVANVSQVVMQSNPVTATLDPSIGDVSTSLSVALTNYTANAPVNITITQGATTNTVHAFQLAAQNAGITNTMNIAYTVNFTNTENINSNLAPSAVVLNMSINDTWVSQNGGIGSIRVIRYPDNSDTPQVLTTRWVGYDSSTNLDWFNANSTGLSIFGMIGFAAQAAASQQSQGGGSGAINSPTPGVTVPVTTPAQQTPPQVFTDTAPLKTDINGVLTAAIDVQSNDQVALLTLPQGIKATNSAGHPLADVHIQPMSISSVPATETGSHDTFSGIGYQCGPDGAQFSPGITITFTPTQNQWNALTTNNKEPVIRDYRTSTQTWESLSTTTNPGTRSVSAQATHFSDFALFSEPMGMSAPNPAPVTTVPSAANPASGAAQQTSAPNPAQASIATPQPVAKSPPAANALEIMIGLGAWGAGLLMHNLVLTVICIVMVGIGYAGWARYRRKKEFDLIMYGRRK
jgi:uncharacterized delta-60 repeat protein